MAGQLNLSLLISADAKGVAPATREARREIESIGQSATQTAAATRLLSAANDEASASQRRAMDAARGRAAAERDLQDAIAKFAGIKPVMGDDGYRQRAADIDAYGTALDDLRAKHNPLFAVERQHMQNLADIDQALKLGAINEAEHAAAIVRAGAAHQLQTTLLTQSGQAAKLNAFEIQNLSFQANDIAMMLMSGQSFGIIMAQQGMQVAQIMGPRGLGEIIPALGGSLKSLVTPTTLFLAGITAAGYAGYYAFRAMVPEAKKLDDVLRDQIDRAKELAESYRAVGDASLRAATQSQSVAFFRAERQAKETALTLSQGVAPIYDQTLGERRDGYRDPEKLRTDPIFGPIYSAVLDLDQGAKFSIPNFEKYQATLAAIGQDQSFSKEMRDRAALMIEESKNLAELYRQWKAYRDSMGEGGLLLSQGTIKRADDVSVEAYQRQERIRRQREQQSLSADILGVSARSPAELEAAARARAAATYNDREGGFERRDRIDNAGILARIEAEHELTRAQDERRRSLDETLASARLDLDLVGKSVAETERLRMEHELLAEVRRVAAANNVKVDEAEIERIREIAAETATLRALQQARGFIRTKDEELAKLQMEQQLIGVSEKLRNRLTAAMEAELKIRSLGIDASGAEAEDMRRHAEATADLTTEIERQAEAWDTYRSASEGAIDGVIDKLSDGDLKGAMESLIDDGKKFASELVGNTVKNAMFNDNLPTLADAPAFLSKLFGGADKGAGDIVASALGKTVGAMNVSAGVVNITGGIGGLGDMFRDGKGGGLLGMLGIDKPGTADKIIRMPLPDVGTTSYLHGFLADGRPASYINYMSGDLQGGLAAMLKDAPASVRSAVSITSGARSVARQAELWEAALAKYGSPEAARRWVAPPGRSQHNLGNAADLGFGTAEARDWVHQNAQNYGLKFPLGNEPWHVETAGARTAGQALDKLTTSATGAVGATENLGKGLLSAGDGLGQFGKIISAPFPAAPAAPGAGGGGFFNWLSGLFGGGAPSDPWAGMRVPTYAVGTTNHPGGPALIHDDGGEVVDLPSGARVWPRDLSVQMASRARVVEGGYAMPDSWRGDVSRSGSGGGYGAGQPFSVQFINQGTPQRVVDKRQENDSQGGRREVYVLRDEMAVAATDPNSSFRQTLIGGGFEPQRALR